MNNKYWDNFYKTKAAPQEGSSFAKFFLNLNLKGEKIIDLGCGNGRDSYLLSRKYQVTGIDPNDKPKDKQRALFYREAWQGVKEYIKKADIVYSRFFLHAIPEKEIAEIIKNTKGYFCAEARAEGDKPVLYKNHKRYFVKGNKLLTKLINSGFEIIYYEKGRGLAKYKSEDPLVIRIIAKRR